MNRVGSKCQDKSVTHGRIQQRTLQNGELTYKQRLEAWREKRNEKGSSHIHAFKAGRVCDEELFDVSQFNHTP